MLSTTALPSPALFHASKFRRKASFWFSEVTVYRSSVPPPPPSSSPLGHPHTDGGHQKHANLYKLVSSAARLSTIIIRHCFSVQKRRPRFGWWAMKWASRFVASKAPPPSQSVSQLDSLTLLTSLLARSMDRLLLRHYNMCARFLITITFRKYDIISACGKVALGI